MEKMEIGGSEIKDREEKGLKEEGIMFEFFPGKASDGSGEDGRETFGEKLRGAGIILSDGLKYSANDEEIYCEILDEFAGEYEKKRAALDEDLKNEDAGAYRIKIHAIKGNLRMIGANTASEHAKELEEGAKRGDIDFLRSSHGAFVDEYENVVMAIRDSLGDR